MSFERVLRRIQQIESRFQPAAQPRLGKTSRQVKGRFQRQLESMRQTDRAEKAAPEKTAPAARRFVSPFAAAREITSLYGLRNGRQHRGIDIAAPVGTPVRSAAAGRVETVGHDENGYGRYIIIDHGRGMKTLYAHLQSTNLRRGQHVQSGDTVALSGDSGRSTGPHLHFEVRVNDKAADPLKYLSTRPLP